MMRTLVLVVLATLAVTSAAQAGCDAAGHCTNSPAVGPVNNGSANVAVPPATGTAYDYTFSGSPFVSQSSDSYRNMLLTQILGASTGNKPVEIIRPGR